MPNNICALREADLPRLLRLTSDAGWNQTEADWRRLLKLSPDGCFGLRVDDEVVATTTTVCFGSELAWIGMVLTLPAFRRLGFARVLMQHALEVLQARGLRLIGLDATPMGQPLYESLGFRSVAVVERWLRPASDVMHSDTRCSRGWLSELDRAAFGADRSALLNELAVESAVIDDQAFAMTRPGAHAAYFGPCIAIGSNAAEHLLTWCLARWPGNAVYWDLLAENTQALRLAQAYGFERTRVLSRMFYGSQHAVGEPAQTFAIAGLEYG
ncbi:MAG: GNAT family N-acetyltransferase [Acidobacteriaceae bacterium]|nr:GNAT family N-acetyltransferase [Acidobacteriaceae bacterium]